jgi:hypothetical protein
VSRTRKGRALGCNDSPVGPAVAVGSVAVATTSSLGYCAYRALHNGPPGYDACAGLLAATSATSWVLTTFALTAVARPRELLRLAPSVAISGHGARFALSRSF